MLIEVRSKVNPAMVPKREDEKVDPTGSVKIDKLEKIPAVPGAIEAKTPVAGDPETTEPLKSTARVLSDGNVRFPERFKVSAFARGASAIINSRNVHSDARIPTRVS